VLSLRRPAQAVARPRRGGDDFQPQAQFARIAPAQHLRAAGVGGQVAADGATAFGGQAQRQQQAWALAASCSACSTQPASAVSVRLAASMARTRFRPLQAQQHLRAAGVGHATAHQAGVAALRHDGVPCCGAGAPRRPPLSVLPGPHHGQRLAVPARRQSSSQASGRPSVSTWAAPTAACSAMSVQQASPRLPRGHQAGGLGVAQPQRHVQPRWREQQQAQQPPPAPPACATARFGGGAHHAFGEVQPHQQAQPAVGVHAVAQQARPRTAASGSTFMASVPLPVGASHSSQARPSTIRPGQQAQHGCAWRALAASVGRAGLHCMLAS
jgi:hypothetical protein